MSSRLRLSALLAATLVLAACASSTPPASSTASSAGGVVSPAVATSPATSPAVASSPKASPAVAAPCDKTTKAFDANHIDLTGPWAGDDDGIYYLRQLSSVLWWNGMSSRAGSPSGLGRDWNNVGRGEIKALKIEVEWADVPRGEILGNGTLSLSIKDDGTGNVKIVKDSETGTGFGNSVWTPCTPG